jgi:hypothetical protein
MYSVAGNEAHKLNVSSPGTWFRRSFFCVCTTHIVDKWYTHSNNEVLLHAEGKSTLSALYTRQRSRCSVSKASERNDLHLSTRKIADLFMLTAVLLESLNWENTQRQIITNPVTAVIFIATTEEHPITAVHIWGELKRKVAGWKNSCCCEAIWIRGRLGIIIRHTREGGGGVPWLKGYEPLV